MYTVRTRAVTCFLIGRCSRRWALPLLLPLAAVGFSAARCWRGAFSSPHSHRDCSALLPPLLAAHCVGRLGGGGVVLGVFFLCCNCLSVSRNSVLTFLHMLAS